MDWVCSGKGGGDPSPLDPLPPSPPPLSSSKSLGGGGGAIGPVSDDGLCALVWDGGARTDSGKAQEGPFRCKDGPAHAGTTLCVRRVPADRPLCSLPGTHIPGVHRPEGGGGCIGIGPPPLTCGVTTKASAAPNAHWRSGKRVDSLPRRRMRVGVAEAEDYVAQSHRGGGYMLGRTPPAATAGVGVEK